LLEGEITLEVGAELQLLEGDRHVQNAPRLAAHVAGVVDQHLVVSTPRCTGIVAVVGTSPDPITILLPVPGHRPVVGAVQDGVDPPETGGDATILQRLAAQPH